MTLTCYAYVGDVQPFAMALCMAPEPFTTSERQRLMSRCLHSPHVQLICSPAGPNTALVSTGRLPTDEETFAAAINEAFKGYTFEIERVNLADLTVRVRVLLAQTFEG